jgi:hypothetical protein
VPGAGARQRGRAHELVNLGVAQPRSRACDGAVGLRAAAGSERTLRAPDAIQRLLQVRRQPLARPRVALDLGNRRARALVPAQVLQSVAGVAGVAWRENRENRGGENFTPKV